MAELGDLLQDQTDTDSDATLDLFLDAMIARGHELYEAQEEALLELYSGNHVILDTPTGSGKSLVAEGLHFKATAEGRRSFYTAPIKALVSEKFFALCESFGAERVGMMTGDASINKDAPIICCTAEILANLALRDGERCEAPYVVMDEFHFYADRERGAAWQIPLITLPHTTFLLMSATLGDVSPIAEKIESFSGRKVATVSSDWRPVPLEFSYQTTPLHETVDDLVNAGKAPLYIVSFTQKSCNELAQSLTSLKLVDKEQKLKIREAIKGVRFDTPAGPELRRFLGFGIAVHHAGLLPRYRLLVEQLAQEGLLKAICGTDTLGVGVNIPIRTVLFTGLSKYDGEKVRLLRVRDFKQISGRAGRRGFDDQGWVVCQAPDHVIENLKAAAKGKKAKKKQAAKGEVGWSEETFIKLQESAPESLRSRLKLDHGKILDCIERDADEDNPDHGNFYTLRKLISDSHLSPERQAMLVSHAAGLIWSLYRAGILETSKDTSSGYRWVTLREGLQIDFELFHALSIFLVEAITRLDPEDLGYAALVTLFAEAVIESPRVILYAQQRKERDRMYAELKAEGVSYDELRDRLDEVSHPQPEAERIRLAFDQFRERHPLISEHSLQPKAIGLELFLELDSFTDFIKRYGLKRSEGVVLRYLSQAYKTLAQNVPQDARTDELEDVIGYLRTTIERTDASLLEEWEALVDPQQTFAGAPERHLSHQALVQAELLSSPKARARRIRSELHQLLRALAERDWEAAVERMHPAVVEEFGIDRLETELRPFFESYGKLETGHRARLAQTTVIEESGPSTFRVRQTLCDPESDDLWALDGQVDLSSPDYLEQPLFRLERILSA